MSLFQNFVQRIKVSEFGHSVGTLRSENGGEYVGKAFEEWLLENGICHETTVAYTPEQNGVAERVNRTILESARSMIHFAGLPLKLWAEECNTAVYLMNRVATKSIIGKTRWWTKV
jgi:transposase InsO family protein